MVNVGAGLEKVTDEALVVVVTLVPALPARSEKTIVNETAPAVSEPLAVYEEVQLLPPVLVVVTVPDTATPPDLKVVVGVWIVSDEVNERVTVSPGNALVVSALFEAMVTVVRVGAVLSNVTDEESVVEVTWVPALPAASEKLTVNETKPSVSPEAVTYVAVQFLPEGLDIVGEFVTTTVPDLNTTVGVEIVFDEVKLNVTVSPTLALAGLELLEAIVTGLNVGVVFWKVTDVASVVDVTAVPAVP